MDTVKVNRKRLQQAIESIALVYKIYPGSYAFQALNDMYLVTSPPDWIDCYLEYNHKQRARL